MANDREQKLLYPGNDLATPTTTAAEAKSKRNCVAAIMATICSNKLENYRFKNVHVSDTAATTTIIILINN